MLVSPRVRLAPDAADTEGPAACFLAGAYGLTARPWQALVVGDWLAVRADGTWASPRCGLSVPRQNGKNGALEIRELFGMVELGERIIHTAHEVKTARKAFRRLLEFFDSAAYPELRALVREVRRTNGQEAILLTNGAQVEFIARSRGSGRGYSGDLLVADEAQAMTDEELAALLPILSTSLNPQLILTGTPPGPRESGEVFNRFRESALSGTPKLTWSEWSAEPEGDFRDRAVWSATNPELGGLLLPDTVEGEFDAMDIEFFARERLGVWFPKVTADPVMELPGWLALNVGVRPLTDAAWSVEVALDRSRATIGAAWHVDDRPHVEIVEDGPGVAWVPARLAELAGRYGTRSVVVDAGTEAAGLVTALEAAGLTVTAVNSAARVQACGTFFDAATSGRLTHNGDPAIAAALAAARWKDVGEGGRVFSRRRSAGDIAALYAVALALHGLVNAAPVESEFFLL